MVIDHHLGKVYVNDVPAPVVGWVYRLMGGGDNYVIVTSIADGYVSMRGLPPTSLDSRILISAFSDVVKEVVSADIFGMLVE